MKTEEDEAFEEIERKQIKLPKLFKELNIGNRVALRLYPNMGGGWSWIVSESEFEDVQKLIDFALEGHKLSDEPFAHVMVFENNIKHCVDANTKGAVPVYTKEQK